MTDDAGYKAYKTYLAMKKHFNSEKYDYHTYHGKIRASLNSYVKRKDRFAFRKIEKNYTKNLEQFFLANFLKNINCWIGAMSDNAYSEWKTQNESMFYQFEQDINYIQDRMEEDKLYIDDIFKVIDAQHPPLLKWYLGEQISLNTMSILQILLMYVDYWKRNLSDPITEEVVLKTEKYVGFLSIDRKKYMDLTRRKLLTNSKN